jgi:very-short-patch-repair endonuclease
MFESVRTRWTSCGGSTGWVIVETAGYATHGGRSAFNGDRTRDARLRMMGYSVQRFSYQHVMHEAAFVAGAVRALLGGSRPPS